MKNVSDMSLEEKIAELKRRHHGSHPDAKNQIEQWEREITQLSLDDSWAKHPNTALLRTALEGHMELIDAALLTDDEMSELDRKVNFKVKNILITLMAALDVTPEVDTKVLHQLLNSEL